MKKIEKFIVNTVSDGKEPSSKRVAGMMGWIVCLIASLIGIFVPIVSVEIIELLFYTSCMLLGLDAVVGMFTKTKKPDS